MKKWLWALGVFICIGGLVMTVSARESDFVWVEGEDAVESDVDRNAWYEDVKRESLSSNTMMTHFSHEAGGKAGTATYEFTIPKTTDYYFWVRANPLRARLQYQMNNGEWQDVKMDPSLHSFVLNKDMINIAADDKPDIRFIAWFYAGKVPMTEGKHRITFRFSAHQTNSTGQHHGYLDCFLFTPKIFSPNGPIKPDEVDTRANEDCWAFNDQPDDFTDDALFDLRSLSENEAGEKGWIKIDQETGDFVKGDGTPIRFWATNCYVQQRYDFDIVEYHAKHLAKRGVNMVRFHAQIGPGEKLTDVIDKEIDDIHKLVAAMKKHGIYSTISPYWGNIPNFRRFPKYGRTEGWVLGLLFWDKEYQDAYKGWVRELFTRPNPYDDHKTPLKDDPSLALFQIQNEDSMLFWPMGDIHNHPEHYNAVNVVFKEWLKKNNLNENVDVDFRFWGMHDLTQMPSESLRLSMRFAAETMRAFNADIEHFIRNELDCPVLINAGNWQVANTVRLLDLERWSYDANEVIAVNKYIDGTHINPTRRHEAGYLISRDDLYRDMSCVSDGWRQFALNLKQIKGKPMLVTESTWVPPNLYQSEGPLLVAAYSALTGIDAYYWFVLRDFPGYELTMSKWGAATPSIMGGWPAAALLFHKDYVKRGDPVITERRALEGDMWELKCPIITEDSSFDPNVPGTQVAHHDLKVPFAAFLEGPVEVEYGFDPTTTEINLIGQDIADMQRGVVKSNTGELSMDAVKGIFIMDTSKAQGVTGFLKRNGVQKTADVTFDSQNEYATAIVVSLDDEPLTTSKKILVQTTTTSRPFGWKTEETTHERDGKPINRIVDTGTPPWSVANTHMTITLNNAGITKATLTDVNFYPVAEIPVEKKGDSVTITLPKNAMYVVLQ